MTQDEARRALDAVLDPFGRAIGLGPLATGEDGSFTLVVDDRLEIAMLPDAQRGILIVWCTLGALPAEGRDAAMQTLLRANLFWQGTAGATLALMPDSDAVVMAAQLPLGDGLSELALQRVVETMADRAETLAGALVPAAAATPESAAAWAIRA